MMTTRRALACALTVAAASLAGSAATAGSLGGPARAAGRGQLLRQPGSCSPPIPAIRRRPADARPDHDRSDVRALPHPEDRQGPALVMVHGSGHTGMTYETTPDGREGWATYFARKNFPVYVVDHAGRGRSSFDPSVINAGAKATPARVCRHPAHRRASVRGRTFALARDYPTPFPGPQFPLDALDQYFSQLVPNTETTLPGGGANTVKALAALLDRIGPAVVLVHSQSGGYGLDLIRMRSDKVRAFVGIEGNCGPLSDDDVANHFRKVPMLSVFGDNTVGAAGPNGDERRNTCASSVGADQWRLAARQGHVVAGARHQGQQPHDDDGQEQPADRRADPQVDRGAGALRVPARICHQFGCNRRVEGLGALKARARRSLGGTRRRHPFGVFPAQAGIHNHQRLRCPLRVPHRYDTAYGSPPARGRQSRVSISIDMSRYFLGGI